MNYRMDNRGFYEQVPLSNTQDDKGSKATIKAAWIGGIFVILAALVGGFFTTGGFGLLHTSSSATNTPALQNSISQQLPQLHNSYNSGSWVTNGQLQQITFTLNGIVESSDGSFTAAGGTLGFCNIKISNGVVKADKSITFSIEQIPDASTNCLDLTADLNGTVTSDGSRLSGTWSGQFGGQPFSGQWNLS